MKVLVVVASKHGSTREIGEVVATELRRQNHAVDLLDALNANGTSGYDAVILGSAVYGGNWLPEAKMFAEHNQQGLSALQVWLFSSGPLGSATPEPHEDPLTLAAPLGEVKPRDHHIFLGKLDLGKLSTAERLFAKTMDAPIGDFRNWTEVHTWARRVAAEIYLDGAPIEQ